MRVGAVCIFFALVSFVSSWGYANTFSSYVGAESRLFFDKPIDGDQSDHSASFSAYSEYYHDYASGDQRIAITAFTRLDSEDIERTHSDLREAYWWKNFGQVELYVGVRKVFWGVTESVHLVDVINQTDNLENIDGEDKLGQPMLQFVTSQDWGTLSAFIMPYFRERSFLGEESRLRPLVQIMDEAVYQDDDEERHVDVALRWSHYLDIWDIGVSHFSGTGRDPIFAFFIRDGDGVSFRPYYRQIDQTGLDLQATIEAWLLKLEVVSIRERAHGRNTALAGGVEYTFFSVAGGNSDLGIVTEYQFDDRIEERQKSTQNDLVLGVRWALNDLDDSSLLALVSQDLDMNNRFMSFEFNRRLNDKWRLEAEARLFSAIEPMTPEFNFRQDDYFQIELRRYF